MKIPSDVLVLAIGVPLAFAVGFSRSIEEGGAAAVAAAALLPTLIYQEAYVAHAKISRGGLYVAFFLGWSSFSALGLKLGAMNDTMMGAILGPGLTFPTVAIVAFLGSESFFDSSQG